MDLRSNKFRIGAFITTLVSVIWHVFFWSFAEADVLRFKGPTVPTVIVRDSLNHDISAPLGDMICSASIDPDNNEAQQNSSAPIVPPVISSPPAAAKIEQR